MSPTSVPLVTPEPSFHSDYVNHELSATLDSTDAFEGPEKLLEIWFTSSNLKLPIGCPNDIGLRSIPFDQIEALLDLVNCKVLSKISSDDMDAYLLSESSLFVFPHKLILKTCGTTTTLLCLEKLFQLAQIYLGWNQSFDSIYRVFYSRRSFMFPERQLEIHQSWDNELNYLNKFFNKKTSKAYVVGDLSNDHWYLYINGSDLDIHNRPLSPPNSVSSISNETETQELDETFELLMTDLSPLETPKFVSSSYNLQDKFPDMNPKKDDYGHLLGLENMELTKLDQIFACNDGTDIVAKHDLFLFDPCGFSSNSIVENRYYYTLHVTPENGWSYASFETNLPTKISKVDLTNRVLQVFKPGKFCLVYMREIDEFGADSEFNLLVDCKIDGYKRIDKISYDLKFNYKCLYIYFEKY